MNGTAHITTKNGSFENAAYGDHGAAGMLPSEIYDGTLNWWRSGIRRLLVKNLEAESRWIGLLQRTIRTPWLDKYFLYSSSLGTHTFFMTAIPLLLFFGQYECSWGIVFVLAMGVYTTSFVKDSICCPRPFLSSVTRLSMGNHHLEYGFPSTHTTNCVSAALYMFLLLRSSAFSASPAIFYSASSILALYAASITVGRVYCGMHSITDCICGILMGSSITLFWWRFGDWIVEYIATGGWQIPTVTILTWALIINQHPQPVDDCPCFEDAIAFISVLGGMFITIWHGRWMGVDKTSHYFVHRMPGYRLETPIDFFTLVSVSLLKIIFGVSAVFAFRLALKPTLQRLLPPTFRTLATVFTLPHRRWYTPATEYEKVPDEHVLARRRLGMGMSVPSVIDLSTTFTNDSNAEASASNFNLHRLSAANGLTRRKAEGSMGSDEVSAWDEDEEPLKSDKQETVTHYDADVLTRAVVYGGIGIIVFEAIPVCFELVGVGLL